MVAWILLSLACRTPKPAAPQDAPNIILVSLDTVRSDHLTTYGHSRDTAPYLDSIAADGVSFTDSYAQASATTPTHASIFTGLHPYDHEAYGYSRTLASRHVTLAELLRDHGWRTIAATSSMKFDRGSGFSQGFEDYLIFGDGAKNRRSTKASDGVRALLAEEIARPVFAFVHYFDAHAPYAAPAPYTTLWHPGMDVLAPEDTTRFIQRNQSTPVPGATRAYLAALYDGNIRFLDDNLRSFLDGLTIANGRETLLIITSDHGEAFGEHSYLGHSSKVYEEIVQVPLVVRWPGQIPPGRTLDRRVQSIDLLPTIGALLDIPIPEGLPGRSHADALRGASPAPPQVIAGVTDPVVIFNRPRNWGLIGDLDGRRFKISRQTDEDLQLFALDSDPGAHRDVIAQHSREASLLMEAAVALGVPVGKRPSQQVENLRQLSQEQLERLEAMGYIDEIEQPPQ